VGWAVGKRGKLIEQRDDVPYNARAAESLPLLELQRSTMRLFRRTRSFWYGLTLPWKALRLILGQPMLMLWSLLPILVTFILYYYVIGALTSAAQAFITAWFVDWGLDPHGWIVLGLQFVSKLILLLVAALTFAFVSSVVASPFNDLLAEKAEQFSRPPLPPVSNATLEQQLRLIRIDLVKGLAAGAASLAALLVCWIPLVNLATFFVAFLLVSFQYLSYPQTRRGLGIRDGVRFLWRHTYACVGFGATVSVLFAMPIVSSIALPIAVVGGTLLAARCPGDNGLEELC
jgi:CysZ protein